MTTGMSGEEAEREPWHEERQDMRTASAILISGESETCDEINLIQVPIMSCLVQLYRVVYVHICTNISHHRFEKIAMHQVRKL